ncbi:MAG: hypothetical protein QXD19_08010 [Candidatus Bathyarchaeia archaeon]
MGHAIPEQQKIEYETVQLKIPKNIMNLLRDFLEEPIEEYLERSIIEVVKADLESDALISHEKVIEKYKLQEIFS